MELVQLPLLALVLQVLFDQLGHFITVIRTFLNFNATFIGVVKQFHMVTQLLSQLVSVHEWVPPDLVLLVLAN